MSVASSVKHLPRITEWLKTQVSDLSWLSADEILRRYTDIFQTPWDKVHDLLRTFKWYKTPEERWDIDWSFIWDDIYIEDLYDVTWAERIEWLVDNSHLTSELWVLLWISFPSVPLFDSPWAIVQIDKDWKIEDSYHNFHNILSLQDETPSPVSEQYERTVLLRMAFEKAYFHHIMSLVPQWTPLHTSIIQELLSKMIMSQQYRWGFHNRETWETIWNSWSSLNEGVVKKIIWEKLWMTIDEYCKICKCWECDVLAGLWDELMSMIISWVPIDVALKSFANDLEMWIGNNTMWLLN